MPLATMSDPFLIELTTSREQMTQPNKTNISDSKFLFVSLFLSSWIWGLEFSRLNTDHSAVDDGFKSKTVKWTSMRNTSTFQTLAAWAISFCHPKRQKPQSVWKPTSISHCAGFKVAFTRNAISCCHATTFHSKSMGRRKLAFQRASLRLASASRLVAQQGFTLDTRLGKLTFWPGTTSHHARTACVCTIQNSPWCLKHPNGGNINKVKSIITGATKSSSSIS